MWDEYHFQWKMKMKSKNNIASSLTPSSNNCIVNANSTNNSINQELQAFIQSIKDD
jgi:hypothetical protein